MTRYIIPQKWIHYDVVKVAAELAAAKAAVLSLTAMPYQRNWAGKLQAMQLKREVAGTSRIEGAEFTEKELDAAMRESPAQLATRSQKQAAAAVSTYRWIGTLPNDRPIDASLILEAHRRLITGADDDHCPPGRLRGPDQNVNFGSPRHRGAEGGPECERAFAGLCRALQTEFRGHDPLIQGLALHYHFAAIHPFLDGNGRTERALEALMLQRLGLKDTLFIAMSNYYYEEKSGYLASLAAARAAGHDLTAFLIFGLRGIALQCRRLLDEIGMNVRKALFRNVMYELFHRLRSPRRRVMAERHLRILRLMLDADSMLLSELLERTASSYDGLKAPGKTALRDLKFLVGLSAITMEKLPQKDYRLNLRLEWGTEITETEFFERVERMPKAKSHAFLE